MGMILKKASTPQSCFPGYGKDISAQSNFFSSVNSSPHIFIFITLFFLKTVYVYNLELRI